MTANQSASSSSSSSSTPAFGNELQKPLKRRGQNNNLDFLKRMADREQQMVKAASVSSKAAEILQTEGYANAAGSIHKRRNPVSKSSSSSSSSSSRTDAVHPDLTSPVFAVSDDLQDSAVAAVGTSSEAQICLHDERRLEADTAAHPRKRPRRKLEQTFQTPLAPTGEVPLLTEDEEEEEEEEEEDEEAGKEEEL